jgi:hypothetical protein
MADDALRSFANRAMHGLSGNKRTFFSKEFIADAYPSDDPFGSLSQLEADAARHGVRIVPFAVSGVDVYMALIK